MKYKIGDKLLIRSKIMPREPYESDEEYNKYYHVCTSRSDGWDKFPKEKCKRVENGYVIHEVLVTRIDNYNDGSKAYHCTNNLSTTGMGWQGVVECDVVGKIKDKLSIIEIIKRKINELRKNKVQ